MGCWAFVLLVSSHLVLSHLMSPEYLLIFSMSGPKGRRSKERVTLQITLLPYVGVLISFMEVVMARICYTRTQE